jgi:hypothetical protein
MGSIHHEIALDLDAEAAWAALRRVELAHKLFTGVLVDARLDGDVRTVTFADGLVVRERIVDVDDERRRLAYSAFDGTPMTHHNASMQIVSEGKGTCRFVWIADFLPHAFGANMLPLVRQGAQALKTALESRAFATATAATD